MKKLLAALFIVGLASSACASLTAALNLTEKDGKLWAKVTLAGIADCPTTGSVTIAFTSPNPKVVESSSFEAAWRSCSQYKNEDGTSGTARTRAYRTIRRSDHLSCLGVWHVTVKAGDTVLAEGDFTVE